jgi:hypothetical protein
MNTTGVDENEDHVPRLFIYIPEYLFHFYGCNSQPRQDNDLMDYK